MNRARAAQGLFRARSSHGTAKEIRRIASPSVEPHKQKQNRNFLRQAFDVNDLNFRQKVDEMYGFRAKAQTRVLKQKPRQQNRRDKRLTSKLVHRARIGTQPDGWYRRCDNAHSPESSSTRPALTEIFLRAQPVCRPQQPPPLSPACLRGGACATHGGVDAESIDTGDLVQDGVLGLIDAAHRFDEESRDQFETFPSGACAGR